MTKEVQTRFCQLQMISSWSILAHPVYRYEDEQWVNDFFETGHLKLSSFRKFASYADEHRGDASEGFGLTIGRNSSGETCSIFQGIGLNAAIFCCSHRLDKDLQEKFQRTSAFRIDYPAGFAIEVARQLPGFREGLEGHCIYRDERVLEKNIEVRMEDYLQADGTLSMDFSAAAAHQSGWPELLFLKLRKYQSQQEYRLAWVLDNRPLETIDVTAPLARQYCSRIQPEDW